MAISGFLRESLLVVKRWGRKWRFVKAKFLRAERWSRFGSLNVTETRVCWGALWASLWGSEKGFIHKELTVQWRPSCQLGFRGSLPGVPFLGLTAFQGSNPMSRVSVHSALSRPCYWSPVPVSPGELYFLATAYPSAYAPQGSIYKFVDPSRWALVSFSS